MIADEDQTSRAKAPNSKRTLYAAMNGRSSTATQQRAPPPEQAKTRLARDPALCHMSGPVDAVDVMDTRDTRLLCSGLLNTFDKKWQTVQASPT